MYQHKYIGSHNNKQSKVVVVIRKLYLQQKKNIKASLKSYFPAL